MQSFPHVNNVSSRKQLEPRAGSLIVTGLAIPAGGGLSFATKGIVPLLLSWVVAILAAVMMTRPGERALPVTFAALYPPVGLVGATIGFFIVEPLCIFGCAEEAGNPLVGSIIIASCALVPFVAAVCTQMSDEVRAKR
jgi:hypothetical protein